MNLMPETPKLKLTCDIEDHIKNIQNKKIPLHMEHQIISKQNDLPITRF